MNEIADNFFDVLNELKTVDKTNAVGETVNSESRDRLSIDNMTERQYNNFSWVTVNNVMSYEEYGSLMHQFDDFKNRKHSYPTTENGEALIIAYDNEHNATKLAGIKGTTANPTISFVIESASDGHYDNYYLEVLRDDAKNILKNRNAYESLQGEDVFRYIGREDYPPFSELKKQRRSSEKGRKNSESFLYGSGSGGENSETGYVSNEPSSTDGGFSMPDNQNYSAKRNATDSNGNVIPLSERFNEQNDDIRWSESRALQRKDPTKVTEKDVRDILSYVNEKIIYDKEKGGLQRGSDRKWSSLLNKSPFYQGDTTTLSSESQDFSEKREQSNLSAYELSEFVSMSDELLEQKRIAEANANELNNLTEFPARKLNQNDIASVVKDLCNTAKAHR